MAYPKKEKLSTEAAVVIVGAALALFVGVFLFVSNQYGGTEEAQVAQHDTTPALPGNELPIAPLDAAGGPISYAAIRHAACHPVNRQVIRPEKGSPARASSGASDCRARGTKSNNHTTPCRAFIKYFQRKTVPADDRSGQCR